MKSGDYDFLDPVITRVLRESPVPLQAMAICFKVNEASKKIVPMNAVQHRLKVLIEQNRICTKSGVITKDDKEKNAAFYWASPIS